MYATALLPQRETAMYRFPRCVMLGGYSAYTIYLQVRPKAGPVQTKGAIRLFSYQRSFVLYSKIAMSTIYTHRTVFSSRACCLLQFAPRAAMLSPVVPMPYGIGESHLVSSYLSIIDLQATVDHAALKG
jgi:hypothetical protein